jgi:hypothetical protein
MAESLFNEPATPRGAGAAPNRKAGVVLAGRLVARRLETTAGIRPPRAAYPTKIRDSATTLVTDLAHWHANLPAHVETARLVQAICVHTALYTSRTFARILSARNNAR